MQQEGAQAGSARSRAGHSWARCPQALPLLQPGQAQLLLPSAALGAREGGSQLGLSPEWAPGGALSHLSPWHNGLSRRQMAVEGLLWHLQLSCWLPFAVWLFSGGHSGTCARLMAAAWESLPGPRADKGEAGQSSSLLRMNL